MLNGEPLSAIGSRTIVSDGFTRECLAIRIDRKLNSTAVIDVLTDLFTLRGVPGHVRSDNGPEFIAKAVRDWIGAVRANSAFIEPGSPWENGYCESFNSRLRPSRQIASQSPAGQWTSCLMARSSTPSPKLAWSSRGGVGTTTRSARTHPWATGLQLPRSCSGRLRHPEPLRRPRQP